MLKCKSNTFDQSSQPLWWDKECESAKKGKYLALRLFRVTNSDQDLQTYLSKRNALKCMNREKKLNLALENRNKLIKSRTNPREFWRLIKSCSSKQSCFAGSDVSCTDWYNYFKKLLNVDVNGDNADNELKNIVHDVNSDELNNANIRFRNNRKC